MTDTHLTGDDLAAQALAESDQESLPAGDDTLSLEASDTPQLPAANGGVQAKVGETLHALQSVIERNVSELDRLKEQMKSYRDSMKNIMTNDETLSDAQEQATQITQKVKERKSQLNASPEVNQLKANISEISERKKEIEEALNTHFLNLYQLTGSKTFDTSTGETREFEIRASVKSGKKAA
jgi:chromosome segregation ATPase